ncbi:tyrosine-type recombinase/integrase [Streptomyces sp. L7]
MPPRWRARPPSPGSASAPGAPSGGPGVLPAGRLTAAARRASWLELRRRSEDIGLPRIGVHDLRHTAATIMISSRVPLAVVSKTLRHSTLSTTVNLYGHLLPYAARDAVTAIDKALTRADRKHRSQTGPVS